MREIRDVEDDRPAVQVADPRPVGPLRVHVGVVRAEAGVERRMAHRRWFHVAIASAGQPPAPHLRRPRGLADVDDAVALVVLRVAGLEVGGAARHVDVGAVDEPEMVHAA